MNAGVGQQRRVYEGRYVDVPGVTSGWGRFRVFPPGMGLPNTSGQPRPYGSPTLPPHRRFPASVVIQAFGEALTIRAINWSLWSSGMATDDSNLDVSAQLDSLAAPLVVIQHRSLADVLAVGAADWSPTRSFQTANPGLTALHETLLSGFSGTLQFPAPAPGTRPGGLVVEAGGIAQVLVGPMWANYGNANLTGFLNDSGNPEGGAALSVVVDVVPQVVGRFDRER